MKIKKFGHSLHEYEYEYFIHIHIHEYKHSTTDLCLRTLLSEIFNELEIKSFNHNN